MKIAVAGLGYVGMSLAVLLAARHRVRAFDLAQARVDRVNDRLSPIEDADISAALRDQRLRWRSGRLITASATQKTGICTQ